MSKTGTETQGRPAGGGPPIPEDLLEILRCPLGKAPLRLEGDRLVCTRCGLRYRIEDGIPNMLIDEAELPAGVTDRRALACHDPAGG
jgi:uncharacterized protein YbaR (Trm112 family)